MNHNTESRIQRLEDIEDIRRLKSLFATRLDDAVNNARPFDAALEQFATDAVWESRLFGRYTGVAQIRGFLEEYRARVSMCLHYVVGDIIDVADDRASARAQWMAWEPMTLDGQAVILAARYFDVYERSQEGWLFKTVRLAEGFLAPYGHSWAEELTPAGFTW